MTMSPRNRSRCGVAVSLAGKAQDVGHAVLAPVLSIELADVGVGHQRQRNFAARARRSRGGQPPREAAGAERNGRGRPTL
jgi:hypothetical protein